MAKRLGLKIESLGLQGLRALGVQGFRVQRLIGKSGVHGLRVGGVRVVGP